MPLRYLNVSKVNFEKIHNFVSQNQTSQNQQTAKTKTTSETNQTNKPSKLSQQESESRKNEQSRHPSYRHMMHSSIATLMLLALSFVRGTVAQAQHLNCPKSQRKSWRVMSCTERNNFLDAVQQLKKLDRVNNLQIPNYDDFVQVHSRNAHASHGLDAFLPWHRWFVYKFERALQIVSNDCTVTLPYWDSELDAFNPFGAKVLEADTFGSRNGVGNGGCVTEGIASSHGDFRVRGGGCLQR